MDKVLFNVVYNRKNQLLKNGTALIQIEAYLRGNKKYFSTNIYITPEQWDWKHRNIKNHPNQITLNKQIKDFSNSLEDVELQRRQRNKPFSLSILTDFVNGSYTNSFIDFFRKELETRNITKTTKTVQSNTLQHLINFCKNVEFENVTFEFLNDFEVYLRGLKQHPNTIKRHFATLRCYVNVAIDNELIDLNKYPFRKFKVGTVKTTKHFLTPEELEQIEFLKLDKENESLQLTLDKFLFATYTGLRFSDVSAIKPEHLILIDNKEWLVFNMQKTGDEIRLPLYLDFYQKALDIIYKYISAKTTIFPFKNNSSVNIELKRISKIAGISKHLTFHVARHTQATYLLYKGVNITTVQKLLGHRQITTTQIYGKVMDMTVINELKNVSFTR